MNELTLESLAKRVEALEAAIHVNRSPRLENGPENGDEKHESSGKLDSEFLNATDRVFQQHEHLLRRLA